MNIDLGQWPTQLSHASDCAYCLGGFVPASDPFCGPGYVRCPNLVTHEAATACPTCGIVAFYALDARSNFDVWLDTLNKTYRLIPEICPTCIGVTRLLPIPLGWGGGA